MPFIDVDNNKVWTYSFYKYHYYVLGGCVLDGYVKNLHVFFDQYQKLVLSYPIEFII